MNQQPLRGKVALVAGGTRGAGRGIAVMLGEAGATVYVTGRSTKEKGAMSGRPETIEETAEMIIEKGGHSIPVRVDHTNELEVQQLFEHIRVDQGGRLDILVNDIWGGDELTEWNVPFWQLSVDKGRLMLDRAVQTHIITSRYAVPLMVERNSGLVIEVTDGMSYNYRGQYFYSLAKISAIHLAEGMASDFKRFGKSITALALTPGFLRSEAILEGFGVTEENWRDAISQDPAFAASETPYYIGRAVVALASDPAVHTKAGTCLSTWDLSSEYGFTDLDGSQPHWENYFKEHFEGK